MEGGGTMAKLSPRLAVVNEAECVACGTCENACPREAIRVKNGVRAVVTPERCVGCGICAKECPATAIRVEARP